MAAATLDAESGCAADALLLPAELCAQAFVLAVFWERASLSTHPLLSQATDGWHGESAGTPLSVWPILRPAPTQGLSKCHMAVPPAGFQARATVPAA